MAGVVSECRGKTSLQFYLLNRSYIDICMCEYLRLVPASPHVCSNIRLFTLSVFIKVRPMCCVANTITSNTKSPLHLPN
ncbi:hypothetical protein QQ045_021949 [Rhodiola kirilowii]